MCSRFRSVARQNDSTLASRLVGCWLFNNACLIATQSSCAARIKLAVRVTSRAVLFTPIECGAALKIGGCDDGGCGERERGPNQSLALS